MPPRGVREAQGRTTAGGGNFSQGSSRPSGGDRPSDNQQRGMSPAESAARYGTQAFAGMAPQQAQNIINMGGGSGGAPGAPGAPEMYRQAAATAQQAQAPFVEQQQSLLRNYLSDVQDRMAGPKLPGFLGGMSSLNLRNLAGALGEFDEMQPFDAANAMRGRIVTNDLGQVIGVYDERGILTGQDPEREAAMRRAQLGEGGQQQIVAPSPDTGQCPDGYIFDEDLQACRLDTGAIQPADYTAPQTYGMMGLLDTAPTGLLEFGQRFGLPPVDFSAANQAFRRAGGTVRQYPGYTLL